MAGRGHNHRGFAKRHPDARPNHPPRRRAGCGRSSRESRPRLSHADSRCNPSASAPGSRTSCVKNRWRPVSSGFPPSLVFPRGPALGDGDLEGTGRWPPLDRRATRRAGGYLPEGLRVRPMFPSPPLGSDRAGFGKPGGGALGHSLRASSAARRGLLAPPRPAASPGLKYPGDY